MSKENQLSTKEKFIENLYVVLFILFIPIILVGIAVYGLWHLFYGLWLGLLVKKQWYPQGKKLLFVYSNSPNWQEYIEQNIFPKLSEKAMIINWSERNTWDFGKTLETKVFKHWTGSTRFWEKGKKKWSGTDFNPIAITFMPWWRIRVFRFWQAFKEHKHGKDRLLKKTETDLFKTIKL